MTTLTALPPSSLSQKTPEKPVTMVQRSLKKGQSISRHQHSWGQLLYAQQGVLSANVESQRFIIAPQQAIWIPANTQHQVLCHSDIELSSFYIKAECFDQLAKKTLHVINVNRLLQELIMEAHNIGNDYDMLGCDGKLMSVMVDRLNLAEPVGTALPFPQSNILIKFISLLTEDVDTIPSITKLSHKIGAGKHTIARRFKKEMGMTFQQWRQLYTIQQAIEELTEGKSIKSIALKSGYHSVAAFTHMFSKHMGCPPSEYLANNV